MLRIRTALVIILVLLSCATGAEEPTGKAESPKKLLTDAELWDIYYGFIAAIKPYGIPVERVEHEKLIRPKMTHHQNFNSGTHSERVTSISSRGDQISVYIDTYTGEIRSLHLWETLFKLEGKTVKPRLSRREVTKIAEKYISLNKTIPLKEYSVTVRRENNHWWVDFARKLDGHKFMLDTILVEYSEEYGLLSYVNAVFSEECDTTVKVSKKIAAALADKYLASVKKKTIDIPMKRMEVEDLKIVNPAYMQALQDFKKVPFSELRKTRLAWPVTYEDASEARMDLPVIIMIYVDALTGKLLYHCGAY